MVRQFWQTQGGVQAVHGDARENENDYLSEVAQRL
jgi:hypothetical protein